MRRAPTFHADHHLAGGVAPGPEFVRGVDAQPHGMVCQCYDVVNVAGASLVGQPGDGFHGLALERFHLGRSGGWFLPLVQLPVPHQLEGAQEVHFVGARSNKDRGVLCTRDVPLEPLEDQQLRAGSPLGLDFLVGVDCPAVVGVAEIAVLGQGHPVDAVGLGGVQLLLDHVLRIMAVLGVNVVIAHQPFQLGVVPARVRHRWPRHRRRGGSAGGQDAGRLKNAPAAQPHGLQLSIGQFHTSAVGGGFFFCGAHNVFPLLIPVPQRDHSREAAWRGG